jgi:hypothetical protein
MQTKTCGMGIIVGLSVLAIAVGWQAPVVAQDVGEAASQQAQAPARTADPRTRKHDSERGASPNTDRPSHAPTQESDPGRDKRRSDYDGRVCQETLHTNEQSLGSYPKERRRTRSAPRRGEWRDATTERVPRKLSAECERAAPCFVPVCASRLKSATDDYDSRRSRPP